MDERIRVLIAGPGPDAGDRLAEIVARTLRDGGMEVVYTDRPQTADQLVATVVQEDADAVGFVVAGRDATPLTRLVAVLAERGVDDVLVFAAGDLPEDGPAAQPGSGVARVFPRDAAPAEVAGWVRDRLRG